MRSRRRERAGALWRIPPVFALIAAVISSGTPGWALGSLVTRTESSGPGMVASRVVLAPLEHGRIFQMVEIHFELVPANTFAWLLPVLTDGEMEVSLCEGDFEELAERFGPRILLRQRQPNTEGCRCDETAYGEPVASDVGVHSYSGNTLDPSIEAIERFESFSDLEEFLARRGFTISQAEIGVLTHYIDHSFDVAYAEVQPLVSTGRVCMQMRYTPPTPRQYDYLLPLMASSFSSAPDTELLIYVVDEEMARPYRNPTTGQDTFSTAVINLDRLRILDEGQINYHDLFLGAVESRDPMAFVVEYSGELDQPIDWTGSPATWMTRLRTVLNPIDMSRSDLALEAEGRDEVESSYEVILASADRPPSSLPMLAALALVACMALRWRGFGPRRPTRE